MFSLLHSTVMLLVWSVLTAALWDDANNWTFHGVSCVGNARDVFGSLE